MVNSDRLLAALAAGAFLAGGSPTNGAIFNAASAAFADVKAAVDSAIDGDVVVIPIGTAKWAGNCNLNISGKAITLQGAGVGKTIIQDAAQGNLINWNLSPGVSRMTGIEFQNPTRRVLDGVVTNGSATVTSATANFTSADLYTGISGAGIPPNTYIGVINSRSSVGLSSSYTANVPVNATASGTLVSIDLGGRLNLKNGLFSVVGSNTNGSLFRWDNCKWSYLNGNPSFDTVIGVIDHLEVWWNNGPWLFNYGNLWNGAAGTFGDGSWTAPTNFGSSQFLFLEDITAHNTRTVDAGIFDNYGGSRIVLRHSQLYSATIQSHGTESTQRRRGVRAVEVYNNTFTRTNAVGNILGDLRSGIMLFHDNQTVSYPAGTYFLLMNHRNLNAYIPWGGSDGTNPWDVNQAGGPFWTGTAASYSGFTVTVNGSPGWTTNQWASYSVRRTTNLGSLTGPNFCIINASGSNTLTYQSEGGSAGGDLKFTAGDSIEIWKVNQALDQPGRARGSLITGNPPVTPSGWNDQVTEPIYCWNNTRTENGAAINVAGGVKVIRSGEHYINGTAMPGYVPYAYPHPLVSGVPASPMNLRIVPGP
jgi:hypothetical protein